MAEEAEHHHDEGGAEDEAEYYSGQARVDGSDDEVLDGDEDGAGPAVQRPPELQRRLGGCAARH